MDADQLGKWRDGALAAQSTLGSVQRLEDAAAKGAYSGGAANLKMTVGSYINGLTGATPKGQIGSELYTAEANNLVLSQVKALGANPSNADVIFIQKTVPQLSTNAEARTAMTEFMRRKAEGAIGLYQRANTHARKNSGLGGFEVVEPTGDIDSLVEKYAPRAK
jgi:surface antigen